MNTVILIVVGLLLLGGVIFATFLGGDRFVIWVANHNKWWSPLRIKPLSGQFFMTVKSRRNGEFDRIIHSVENHIVDDKHNFIEDETAYKEELAKQGYWERELGVVWVGFYRDFFVQEMDYIAIDKKPGGKTFDVVEKKRNASAEDPYYYFQYVMAAVAEGVEITGNIRIDMVFLFTARIVNPYKAYFLAGKWPARVTTAVEREGREFARDKSFEDIRKEHGSGAATLVAAINTLGDTGKLKENFGLEIDHAEFVKFDLTKGDPEVEKALRAKEVAKNLADAAVEDARKITILGEAEATKVRQRYEALRGMPGAPSFAIADAIREAKPSTVVVGEAAIAVGGNK